MRMVLQNSKPLLKGSLLFLLTVSALLLQGTWMPIEAQTGGLSISPRRVVFEERKRSVDITLINNSAAATTYRVFFKNMRMNENGLYEKVEKAGPDDKFADQLIRYTPRVVTVPAKNSQTVRLMVRKPHDLAEGEYRSHLVFQAQPPSDTGTSIESLKMKEGELQVRFIPILSLSIPILVRHGKLSSTVTMSDLKLQPGVKVDDPPNLSLAFHRKGNRSSYGDLKVTFKPQDGSAVEVGLIRGIAIFTPREDRTLAIPLTLPEGISLKDGNLHAVYLARPEDGGEALAEADLSIP